MVIFDELFRGTNVKDAYDATLLVSQGFTKAKRSLFFISSHIIEIGQPLKENASVDFKCLESELIEGQAVYNYRLKEGLSSERLGLTILANEKVLEIMDSLGSD